MKYRSLRRCLALFLCVLMLTAVFFAVVVVPVFAADVNIQNGTGNRFMAENFNKFPAMYVYSSVKSFKGNVYRDGYPVESGVQYPVMQIAFSEEKEA